MKLPQQSKIVIVGGGIIGSSAAYHLAHMGETDCVVLEQGQLTNGSTWHAAGLVGQLRSSANVTQLLKYSVELYAQLEKQTGQATGWKQNGGLRLASHQERVREIKRQVTMARSFGLDMHFLTPQEAVDLCPVLNGEDLLGAAFIPSDGQANPSDLSQALAKGARLKGVQFIEGCEVTEMLKVNNTIAGLNTTLGQIQCETVINCAGMWSRRFGELAGVNIPVVPMKHHYIVTGAIDGVDPSMPTIRDPDSLIYFKEEVGGLVFGGYELNPQKWEIELPPNDFFFTLLDFDIDHFSTLMTAGINRIPAMAAVDVKQMICGPESFTPDGNFMIGKIPDLANYFVGTGFNAFGIASAGGAGKALAEWVIDGAPSMDLAGVDIRRFGKVHRCSDWIAQRTIELCSKHYTMAWPHEEHLSARPAFKSPLYDQLRELNASFGEKMGWERPNWYASPEQSNVDCPSFGRPNWFEPVGEEHRAIRERVGMIDQSSFAKFELTGQDACAALEWICANRIDRPAGSVIYTQMLNQSGGIECDVTIARIESEKFLIVAGTAYAYHHFHHINNHIASRFSRCRLRDVSFDYATLSLSGPNSRKLLKSVTDAELDREAFRFSSCKKISILDHSVLAIRVSFAGELGWELHMPIQHAPSVFGAITDSGPQFGLAHAGYRALESLRLEKGFRALGTDIGPDFTPLEAGLDKVVRIESEAPFIGQDALQQQAKQPLTKFLTCFSTADKSITLHGRETIYRNGKRVGWTTSAGWGYTVNKNIAYGYVRNANSVDAEYLRSGAYELEVEEMRVPVIYEPEALYDPKSLKMRV